MIKFNPAKIRNLINERRKSDVTFRQGRFLEEIKLSLTGLNKILDGKSEPGVETLSRIASYFGKDMNYFFDLPEVKFEQQKSNDNAFNELFAKRFEELIVENTYLKIEAGKFIDVDELMQRIQKKKRK